MDRWRIIAAIVRSIGLGFMAVPAAMFESSEAFAASREGVARLTKMAFAGRDLRPLWHTLMEKVTDDQAGAGIGMDLSVIAQLLGDQPTGLAIQRDVLAYQRLFRSPCASRTPSLRLLCLAAQMDMGGNTPVEFLLEDSDIDITTLYVVPGSPLPDPLPDHDIAFVVAPDDVATRETLALIETLAPSWPRPLLNRPSAIAQLDRDRLYHLLKPVAGLEIPITARVSRAVLSNIASVADLRDVVADAEFPVIVRPVGSHAGHGLEKLDTAAGIARYLAAHDDAEFFVSRFVNYASPDGLYRKYRVVCIDGRPYACHMAISEQWNIWYLNADMILNAANRAEEAHFMERFDEEFAARHGLALAELASRIGLDYLTVDCAESKTGELLVFEADNTAIVHNMDPPEVFPYKAPQMRKIFKAFEAMLHRRAGAERAAA